MATANDRLVWIDCEMTGLDLAVDELVEVAVVITDFDLVPVHPGFDIVIKPDQSALDNMNEFVTNMHTTSGLIDEIPDGVSLADAEYQVLEYILAHVPGEGTAPLAGNTIGTDRAFLAKYMPRVATTCTTGASTCRASRSCADGGSRACTSNAPEKHGGHRALADILESIRELEYYRRAGFVADPGPSTDDVRAVQAEVVAKWEPRSPSPPSDDTRGRSPAVHVLLLSGRAGHPAGHGGYSSVGRAPGCGLGGRGFETRYSPHDEEPRSFGRGSSHAVRRLTDACDTIDS